MKYIDYLEKEGDPEYIDKWHFCSAVEQAETLEDVKDILHWFVVNDYIKVGR